MNEVLKLEAKPLSFDDLKKMMHGKPIKLIHYDDLAKVGSLAELLSGPPVIILLEIEGSDQQVGHWIIMLNHGNHYEHFDSYGLTADEELGLTHEKPYLSALMRDSDKPTFENQEQFQQFKEHVNTCGRWVVCRAYHQHMEGDQFSKYIKQFHHQPDVTVTLLTRLL